MTRVWDRLFIGGIDDALDIAESNPFGITTVIALCHEPIRIRRGGVNYMNFPVVEAHSMPTRWLDPIIDALWENIRWGKVLVVGNDGTSSASIIAAAWMHAVGCMDIDAALAYIGKFRNIEPSPFVLRSAKRALR
jgi:protein-tyrosine phosphatase